MKKVFLNIITALFLIPLFSCKNSEKVKIKSENKSYINNFQLIQDNPNNKTRVEIISPRAIIDLSTNDIQIFDSSIQIMNQKGNNLSIKSGNSKLNNSSKIINVYNNVFISLVDDGKSFITTNSFNWDLNTSNIILNSPLDISFDNSKLLSSGGFFDINIGLLRINDNVLNRSIFDKDGNEKYRLQIESDNALWFKDQNLLEFTSNKKQVETTIDILGIK